MFGLRNQVGYDGRLGNGTIGAVRASDELQDLVSKAEN